MKILAIETSCDETSAAVVVSSKNSVELISQTTASSMQLHSKTGGIIPEVAAREQSTYIIPVIRETLKEADLLFDKQHAPNIDAIAVTYGPGLIGSLLVGVETAKTLSFIWNKPLIPVNHLFGHIYANFIRKNSNLKSQIAKEEREIELPFIALIVSGGHTDLLLMKNHTDIVWLGGTRDDAAGECFDKVGRLLDLPYPAGPLIEQRAKLGNPKTYHFPRPLLYEKTFDFSFSGLKTAVLREVTQQRHPALDAGSIDSRLRGNDNNNSLSDPIVNDICRGVQDAIIDVLVHKTVQAAEKYQVTSIVLSGGVAANETLKKSFENYAISHIPSVKIFVPAKSLCTDNAAMIGAAAVFQNKQVDWRTVAANPELYFD